MLLFLMSIIAPSLFWILYFYYKDRFQPEPLLDLGFSYLLGFLFSFLCYKFYYILQLWNISYDISSYLDNPSPYLFVYLTMVTGVVEEFFKLIPYVFILKFFTNFDEPLDSIVYASVIALGFASYENFLNLKYLSGIELYARAIASPLTHTIFSSIWGYYIYKFLKGEKRSFTMPVSAFIFASVSHGLYDYFLFTPVLRILSSLLILGIWLWRIIVIEKLQKKYSNYKNSKMKIF